MNNKFFIFAPSNSITGGQECLHQLCDSLNNKGKDAYIIYFPNPNARIPDVYLNYNIKTAKSVEDSKENILVLFESQYDRAFHYRKINLVLWWLSVDNFFECSMHHLSPIEYIKYRPNLLLHLVKGKLFSLIKDKYNIFKNNNSIRDIRNLKTINLCQSYYAENFLLYNKFNQVNYLFDYINSEFTSLDIVSEREDIILYNPKKGLKFIKKLIKQLPKFKWIPIINMNYKEIANLMAKSKIYVDFGKHPGRDKIPREAVAAGLCVLTGKKGSAFFYGDIPISDEYKFDENNFNIVDFESVIKRIFLDYEGEYKKFQPYLDMVKNSKITFENQIDLLIANIEQK